MEKYNERARSKIQEILEIVNKTPLNKKQREHLFKHLIQQEMTSVIEEEYKPHVEIEDVKED